MEHPAFTMAGLTGLGGVMGYLKKNSKPSLFGGLAVSGLYLTAAILLKENADYGIETAIGASTVLLGASIPRIIKAGIKPVPVGLAVLGGLNLGYYIYKYKQFYP
ncbi:TMEM14 protein-like protein [Yarrowia sp. B02]|nr:TMEM14 protein-like protein [Yarrowia sp. B02]